MDVSHNTACKANLQ